MTAADALKDKWLVRQLAINARVEERTMERALQGMRIKGTNTVEAIKKVLKDAGVDLPGDAPALSLVEGGKAK